jgi:membrane dipeptidase
VTTERTLRYVSVFAAKGPVVGTAVSFRVRRILIAVVLAGAATSALVAGQAPSDAERAVVARARAIHERVITLDTHDDIDTDHFVAGCNYTQRLTTQVNLPKMKEGGLDVAFFIVYVGQGPLTPEGYANAYAQAIAKFVAVHRLTEEIAPREIGLALTAADVRRIAATGRKVAVIGIENGYPIGTDISRVAEFHRRGGRYMSLAHNGHNQLSDSNTGENTRDAPNGGLSPLGRQVIAEMNRLGIMVDVSHPSRASMLQTAALSKAPIIASHSAVRALANHSRNMDDEQLLAVKKSGGVVQIVAFGNYIKTPVGASGNAVGARGNAVGASPNAVGASPCPIEAATTTPRPSASGRATVKDFVDHIDYAVKLIGLDHVGISSDFDGGGGIAGWDSAAETFNVTLELVRRGYTEAQIEKLWSGNLLRVWGDVEAVARRIQAEGK